MHIHHCERTPVHIRPNLFGRLFGAVKKLELTDAELIISSGGLHSDQSIPSSVNYLDLSDLPIINRRFFGVSLLIHAQAKLILINCLTARDAERVLKILESRTAANLSTEIDKAVELLRRKVEYEYFRDSSTEVVEAALQGILERYGRETDRWNSLIDTRNVEILRAFNSLIPIKEGKKLLRQRFEKRMLEKRKNFYDDIESNPLTEQQRLSVIRNNDLNLVLAAAGTGKTSVMVAKVVDLIESGRATDKEVLVLAFNKAAANELKERVERRGETHKVSASNGMTVSTFHALGRNILKECGIPVHMSVLAEDSVKLKMWVTSWLCRYMKSSREALRNFIKLSYQPVNPFEFKTRGEYESYCRDNEYRTLQGDLVKGYQEWLIANWLFEQGIEYEYESAYVSKKRIDEGVDYKPDFHFVGTGLYLEHFGIARDGSTRPDINRSDYNESIVNKRQLHEECGTTLIETYHYDWVEGMLEARLESLVLEHGIRSNLRSLDDLFVVLNELGFVDESAERYLKCLQAIRAERLDNQLTLQRLVDSKIVYAEEYSELLSDLHKDYVDELKNNNSVDFDDMIIRSTELIENGAYIPSWKHVLVDEFQDISMARMMFLKVILDRGNRTTLTAVGDDWQSIYRFAGGKLELTTRFEALVGQHTVTKLERTFRYNSSIADTAGKFVMQNPEQYKKTVEAHEQVDTPQVYLLDSTGEVGHKLEDRTLQVIKRIRQEDPEGSIAVLARYHYLLNAVRKKVKTESVQKNIYYWTFHGSKGLESDYCILIGFFRGKSGFPNSNREQAVVEALLPVLDKFVHSEERRLMYVGLTRARKKSYLIAEAKAPSTFIDELLTPRYDLQIASKSFEAKYRKIFKCPLCEDGYFKKHNSQYGEFFRCTSNAACIAKPRTCEKCGSPSLDTRNESVCNNDACRNVKAICNICGRPMKERNGRFGRFLGCTGYGIPDDRCENTRKLF